MKNNLFKVFLPLALAGSLSACNGMEDINPNGLCAGTNENMANTDARQTFRIVDSKTGDPVFVMGKVEKRNATMVYGDAWQQYDISENDGIPGWRPASHDGFKVYLKDGKIVKCAMGLTGSVFGPKP